MALQTLLQRGAEERFRVRSDSIAQRVAASIRPLFEKIREEHELVWDRLLHPGSLLLGFLATAVDSSIVVKTWKSSLREALKEKTVVDLLASIPGFGAADAAPLPRDTSEALEACVAALIHAQRLGYVDYRAPRGVAAYSYPLRRVTPSWWSWGRVVLRQRLTDPKALQGLQTTHWRIARVYGRATFVTEQHVHHLHEAIEVPLRDFSGPRPARVRALWNNVPWYLRPYLTVITGKIVEEEVHRLDVQTQRLTSTVVKTWKDSPALCLGDLVLAGWSSDDLVA